MDGWAAHSTSHRGESCGDAGRNQPQSGRGGGEDAADGDAGSLGDLSDSRLPFTQEFDKILEEIVKQNGNADSIVMQGRLEQEAKGGG